MEKNCRTCMFYKHQRKLPRIDPNNIPCKFRNYNCHTSGNCVHWIPKIKKPETEKWKQWTLAV